MLYIACACTTIACTPSAGCLPILKKIVILKNSQRLCVLHSCCFLVEFSRFSVFFYPFLFCVCFQLAFLPIGSLLFLLNSAFDCFYGKIPPAGWIVGEDRWLVELEKESESAGREEVARRGGEEGNF